MDITDAVLSSIRRGVAVNKPLSPVGSIGVNAGRDWLCRNGCADEIIENAKIKAQRDVETSLAGKSTADIGYLLG